MKNLLWIGDAACPSGFGRATEGVLETLQHHFNVTVLGLNYRGDPHPFKYSIYSAYAEGDLFGVRRLIWMCDVVKPDVIVIQNDPWNFAAYLAQLKRYPEYSKIPVVGVVAVDGKNCNGAPLQGLSLAIFWTEFGRREAHAGGYKGPSTVVPLGVDLQTYYPISKDEARQGVGLDVHMPEFEHIFIVGSVNRNQPRKRWDLTVKYFCEWIKEMDINDAYLFLHTAPTGDTGIDVPRLMEYYGLVHRLILVEPATFYGKPEEWMRATYNSFDVAITTTQGEGMGLTTLEAMACRVPNIAPDWAALGDWGKGAIKLIPCSSTAIGPPYVTNVLGGIPDKEPFITALDAMYCSRDERQKWADLGYARACEPQFRWEQTGTKFLEAIQLVLEGVPA